MESGDTADTEALDLTLPPPGGMLFYLIRPTNGCPLGGASAGAASNGTPRVVRPCP